MATCIRSSPWLRRDPGGQWRSVWPTALHAGIQPLHPTPSCSELDIASPSALFRPGLRSCSHPGALQTREELDRLRPEVGHSWGIPMDLGQSALLPLLQSQPQRVPFAFIAAQPRSFLPRRSLC